MKTSPPHHRALFIPTLDPPPQPLHLTTRPTPSTPPPHGTINITPLAISLTSNARAIYTGTAHYPLPTPLVPGGNAIARVLATPPDAANPALAPGSLCFFSCCVRARDDPDAAVALVGVHAGVGAASVKLATEGWRDGTMAEVAAVPLENVFPLDEGRLCGELGYGVADLAKLPLCVTGYGALSDAGVGAGDTVVVAPATGGFGGAVVAAGLAVGCRVVACGRTGEKLKRLEEGLGETYKGMLRTVTLVGDKERDTKSLREAVGPRGADCYTDWTPASMNFELKEGESPKHMAPCISVVRPRGTVSLAGGLYGDVTLPDGLIMFKNLTVKGTLMYRRHQVVQMIKMLENGNLKLGKSGGVQAPQTFGLERIEEAFDAAERDAGWSGNVVVMPNEN